MKKLYKISSSLFHNERLKAINFHGKDVLPLYVRLVYNRESAFFKSYYFDLYEHPRYSTQSIAGNKSPSIENIIKKEEELIGLIKNKNQNNFSLEIFKKDYQYYCRNILALMEEPFMDYLKTFLQDEGNHVFAALIGNAKFTYRGETILEDFKSVLKPALYNKLLENAVFYAPPYIPLTAFVASLKQDLPSFLPVYKWGDPKIKIALRAYLEKKFPSYSYTTTSAFIDNLTEQPSAQ